MPSLRIVSHDAAEGLLLTQQEAIKLATDLSPEELQKVINGLSREEVLNLADEVFSTRAALKKSEDLIFYQPVSEETKKIHLSTAKITMATGGNRSGKTDSMFAEAAIQMTGIIPYAFRDIYPKEKIRCPMAVRLVCKSLTNTWEPVLKPKLLWNKWSGRGEPGGKYGHWGWIPKRFLKKGDWTESWSEKYRTLTLVCGCTLEVMSYENEVEDFSGGSFHLILFDEGPSFAIYRENLMRTMDVGGRIMIAMTPPDEQSAAWDAAWIYDEIHEKGLLGPAKDPSIDSFALFTEDNRILDPKEIMEVFKGLSPQQKEVRGKGRFLHLGGRIYSTYSDRTQWWCFQCNNTVLVEDKKCLVCESPDVADFCHTVQPFEDAYSWPCVFLLDPHPRKPHIMSWVTIDPLDDWWEVADLEIDADLPFVAEKIMNIESSLSLDIAQRIIDPNMGRSQAHNAGRRHVTVAEEFAAVGVRCNDSVGDDFTLGMMRVSERLKPDPRTRKPRFHIFNSCVLSKRQFNKFSWGEWARYSSDERDPKQRPQEKNDDVPKLMGYLANYNPTFSSLKWGMQPIKRSGRRRGY